MRSHQIELFGKLKEKDLKDYALFFEDNALERFEIEENGIKVKLERDTAAASVVTTVPTDVVLEGSQAIPAQQSTKSGTKEKLKNPNLKEIKSPIIGTFYASPSPETDPFVSVGKMVDRNDVVGIIEAMKAMNEIKAGVSGKITEILVSDGDVVSAEQVIMRVE